ncbi:MAG: YhcH/YjgK/YiaL family protein [Lachnospiraceae bacterium]|nr:YhcH/YjgK/YiaL family protein [Lachnospiraceae bacterium]
MIVDKIENLAFYPLLQKHEELIKAFIERLDEEDLAEGHYDLADDMFALVQRYSTKPMEGALMESHKEYADIQYIHQGEEIIYVDFTDELTVAEDRTPDSDILFYERREPLGGNLLKKGMFGYYAPQDAHMPCITAKKPCDIVKVVFKVKVQP